MVNEVDLMLFIGIILMIEVLLKRDSDVKKYQRIKAKVKGMSPILGFMPNLLLEITVSNF